MPAAALVHTPLVSTEPLPSSSQTRHRSRGHHTRALRMCLAAGGPHGLLLEPPHLRMHGRRVTTKTQHLRLGSERTEDTARSSLWATYLGSLSGHGVFLAGAALRADVSTALHVEGVLPYHRRRVVRRCRRTWYRRRSHTPHMCGQSSPHNAAHTCVRPRGEQLPCLIDPGSLERIGSLPGSAEGALALLATCRARGASTDLL